MYQAIGKEQNKKKHMVQTKRAVVQRILFDDEGNQIENKEFWKN